MTARFVVAAAALPRSAWFPLLAQWANAGVVSIELVKCVGLDEVIDRVEGDRPFSAVLVDAGLPGLDRDLLARSAQRGVATIVVEDPRVTRDWRALGASATLHAPLERAALLSALSDVAEVIHRVEHRGAVTEPGDPASPLRATVVAVVGSGGTGTSTVAMGIAQAAGSTPALRGKTLLVDCCLCADLAMLHDTRRVAPGIQELVEAHRGATLAPERMHEFIFVVEARGYDLLAGIRRRRLWSTLRPEACRSAFASLTNAYSVVVADTDADLDGEDESGSIDIEDRNVLARTAVRGADRVVAVGTASLKGLHSLTRVIGDLRGYGIHDSAIQPVLNMAPASARVRAGYTAALAELLTANPTTADPAPAPLAAPVFLPIRNVDERLRAVEPLPAGIVDPLRVVLDSAGPHHRQRRSPRWGRIRPGTLASPGAGT